jgi:hypothetical protein
LLSHRALIYWNQAKPILWPALDNGETAPEKIVRNLASGDMQLWVAWDDGVIGAAITEIATYWKVKSLRVVALAGSRAPEWFAEGAEWLERFGRRHNCSRIEMYGRPGWGRHTLMREVGFKQKLVVMYKEL